MKTEFTIGNGTDPAPLGAFLRNLNMERAWTVTVERKIGGRSMEQNRLYHKWIGIIATDAGHTHNEIHEWCRAEFLEPKVIDLDGTVHTVLPSTTRLKVGEMSEYMDQIHAWAGSFHGINLPIPEEMHEEINQ